MAEYRIRILTTAETGAIQQSQRHFKQLTEEVKKLTHGTDAADKKTSDLVKGLKKVGSAIPGFQFAIGSLTNVYTLLAAAIVGTVVKIREWDEVIKQNQARLKIFQDLNKEVTRFSENIKKARLDTAEFNREFEAIRAAGAEETPTEEGARVAAATKRQFGAAQEREAAAHQLALDQIARQEAAGKLTPGAAEQARLVAGAAFGKRKTELDLTEQAELARISRQTAGAEAGRADLLRQQVPEAQAAVVAAQNRRDDQARALQAAQEFAGLDAGLKPVAGGRMAQIQAELAISSPISSRYVEKKKLRGEQESLRAGVLQQQALLEPADLALQTAQARLGQLRGATLGAATAGETGRATAAEQMAAFRSSSRSAADVAALTAQSFGEQSITAQLKEAARMQTETAKDMREVLRTLGQGINEVRGLKAQSMDLLSRSKANVQSE